MAITIDGVTYRNLQEQVGKNAEDIYDLRKNSARAIVKGETPLEKVHVTGESNLEGPVTAGGPMEVDGPLTVNSPNDIGFKEDDSSLKQKLDEKLGSEGGALAGSISGSGMSINGKNGTIQAQSIKVGTEQNYANIRGESIYVYSTSYGTGSNFVFPHKTGTLALLSDLRARFRHTITIEFEQGEIRFTTISFAPTHATSFQDLASLFGSTQIACSGVIGRLIATLVHIGNSLTDSRVYMITIGSTDAPSSSSATFDELALLNIYDYTTPL